MYPSSDPASLVARLTAVNLILQGLVERLLLTGALTPADMAEIKSFALAITDALKAHGSTGAQVGGERVADEIRSWFHAMDVD